MMKNELTTYTSPRTGTEYLVVPKTSIRSVGDWYKGESLRKEEFITYEIVLNGNPVQFCFDKADVARTVEHYENPGPDLGSRWD